MRKTDTVLLSHRKTRNIRRFLWLPSLDGPLGARKKVTAAGGFSLRSGGCESATLVTAIYGGKGFRAAQSRTAILAPPSATRKRQQGDTSLQKTAQVLTDTRIFPG